MFDNLTTRLQDTFRDMTGRGSLTEKNIEDAMADVRRALLEADVNYDITKQFIEDVSEECLGSKVLRSVTPGQQFVKVVSDRLGELMGAANEPLVLEGSPSIIMMVGLHGSGKTTSTGKLAARLTKDGKRVLMVAMDVHRPAAIDQLETLGSDQEIDVFSDRGNQDITNIAEKALSFAKLHRHQVVIFDTAGRLQVDEPLVRELESVKNKTNPAEVLLVADAALGQEAVSVATHFNDALGLSGIILTKMDGDARGGAALSMRKVTGQPIKFIGVGEKVTDFEPFHPDRMARRILGMGDIVGIVEQAEEIISEEEAKDLESRLVSAKFDFNDFIKQLDLLSKFGGMGKLFEMLPLPPAIKKLAGANEGALKQARAMVQSMTPFERKNPPIMNDVTRRKRVSRGCGLGFEEVTGMMQRFEKMRQMMAKMGPGGLKQLAGTLESLGGLGGAGGGMPPGMMGPGGPNLSGFQRGAAKQASQKEKKAKRKKGRRRR